jgi:hypothetical protein
LHNTVNNQKNRTERKRWGKRTEEIGEEKRGGDGEKRGGEAAKNSKVAKTKLDDFRLRREHKASSESEGGRNENRDSGVGEEAMKRRGEERRRWRGERRRGSEELQLDTTRRGWTTFAVTASCRANSESEEHVWRTRYAWVMCSLVISCKSLHCF